MTQAMVRHKVKPRAERNEQRVRAVYEELDQLHEVGSFRLIGSGS
jgi:hypothetical protein